MSARNEWRIVFTIALLAGVVFGVLYLFTTEPPCARTCAPYEFLYYDEACWCRVDAVTLKLMGE